MSESASQPRACQHHQGHPATPFLQFCAADFSRTHHFLIVKIQPIDLFLVLTSSTAQANQATSNLCRAINVVFSESFVNDLKTVNDKKARINHETGNTHKHFWIRTALAYNNRQDDNVVLMVNEVVNDTFDTAAAVATEFDTDATDDNSLKLVVVMAKMEQNTNQETILNDSCSYQ